MRFCKKVSQKVHVLARILSYTSKTKLLILRAFMTFLSSYYAFPIWVFFHEYPRFTIQERKKKAMF